MNEYKPDIVEALKGHVSQETAYLVEDYPYGFRLRCQIRYWLEFKKGKGFRFVSQTSNPKVAGLVWNKPKASTYVENAAFMHLDSNGHVQWHGLGIYADAAESKAFLEAYGQHINAEWLPVLERWVALKEAFEAKKAELEKAAGNNDYAHTKKAAIHVIAEDFKKAAAQSNIEFWMAKAPVAEERNIPWRLATYEPEVN